MAHKKDKHSPSAELVRESKNSVAWMVMGGVVLIYYLLHKITATSIWLDMIWVAGGLIGGWFLFWHGVEEMLKKSYHWQEWKNIIPWLKYKSPVAVPFVGAIVYAIYWMISKAIEI